MKNYLRDGYRKLRYGPPKGLTTGRDVWIGRPRHRIECPERIFIGDRTRISENPLIAPITEYAGRHYEPRIEIGSDVYIGSNVYLAAIEEVIIGDGCVLSESVYVNDASHGLSPEAGLIMGQELKGNRIHIGKHCFLGLRSAIMPGVILGDHCIVGVNSVVTKSFPSYSMIAGAPAKLIKRYSFEKKQWISATESE